MTSLMRRAFACVLATALTTCLTPFSSSWAEESLTPPEGDSTTSPFSPDGWIELDEVEAGAVMPYGMDPSKYQRLMQFALQYHGWAYVWGGRYPSQGGFDCAGLVMYSFNNVFGTGFDLMYTNAERLYNNHCSPITPAAAQPGDLVFYRGTYGSLSHISHVAIYCGNGMVYAAGDPIGYYRIDSSKNINGDTAEYFFASVQGLEDGYIAAPDNTPENTSPMYRLYNPNSGEHFYTASSLERSNLIKAGWKYEQIGWYAPTNGENVYRLYNPNAGDHHYTTSVGERDLLMRVGWSYEGVGWKSGGSVPLYRQYNPNARAGAHNFTTSMAERNMLISNGWRDEGTAWYGIQ